MAFIRGETGRVRIGNKGAGGIQDVGVVTSWTANVTRETYEVTRIGENFRQYTGGMLTVTGTVEFIYDTSDTGAAAIITALKNTPDSEIVRLYLGNNSKGDTIASDVIFNSLDASATVGEIATMTANFSNSGEVTFTAPT